MEHLVLFGLGGLGATAVESVVRDLKQQSEKKPFPHRYTALALDYDLQSLYPITASYVLCFPGVTKLAESFSDLSSDVLDYLYGDTVTEENLRELASRDNRSRKLGAASFYVGIEKASTRNQLKNRLQSVCNDLSHGDRITCYFISSVEGSFGSAVMIPLAYYVRRFFAEQKVKCKSYALLMQPFVKHRMSLSVPPPTRRLLQARAYATMRELSALNLLARGYNLKAFEDETIRQIVFALGHRGLPETKDLFSSADLHSEACPLRPPFHRIAFLDNDINTREPEDYRKEVRKSLETVILHHLTNGAPDLPEADKSAIKPYDDMNSGRCYIAYKEWLSREDKDPLLSHHSVNSYHTFPYINPEKEKSYHAALAPALLYAILTDKVSLVIRNRGIFLKMLGSKTELFMSAYTGSYLSYLYHNPPVVEKYSSDLTVLYQINAGNLLPITDTRTVDDYIEDLHQLPVVQKLLYGMTATQTKEKTCNIATLGYFETETNFVMFKCYPTQNLFTCGWNLIRTLAQSKLRHDHEQYLPLVMKAMENKLRAAIQADTTLTSEEKSEIHAYLNRFKLS